MKLAGSLILCLILFLGGLPIVGHADGERQVFALPEATVGDKYHVDVESVLKKQYALRIESDAQTSILQWSSSSGELPQGLTVGTNGIISGLPVISAYREAPYRFRLQVVDIGIRSRPLELEMSLVVGTPAPRLTKIESPAPRLVPVMAVMNDSGGGPNSEPSVGTDLTASLPVAVTDGDPLPPLREPNPPPNLLKRTTGSKDQDLEIDMPPAAVPTPLEVTNGTVVTVTGTKSPVENCVVTTKREELKPEPNPLAQMIKILVGLGTFGVADVAAVANFCPRTPAPVPADAEAQQVENQLNSIRQSLFDGISLLKQSRQQYQQRAKRVKNFTACKATDGVTNICTTVPIFDGEKANLAADLDGLFQIDIPSLESTELQLGTLKKVLADRYKRTGGAAGEAAWIVTVNETLDCFTANLEAAKKSREFLQSVRSDLEKFRETLEAHRTSLTYAQVLLADANAKVTGSVTCTNSFTKQVSVEAVPFTITYQDIPRFSVSAGVLFSLLNKRQIQVQPARTGTAADGTPTFRLEFTETDTADNQVVPFSFFNYYLTGTRKLNLNASAGVGLNPNNGSNQVEYFFGGALGIKNLFLQFGGHVGRWQELDGGFNLGEPVPDKFPSSVPIKRRYSVRPGFGLSYKLPLP
jgi:hypothetical protein